ncbi:hypothetical protein ACSVHC_09035 [Arthrobacter sp. KNU-44]|uniref:hypothetical protein n=1 Tax=Arthrobacter sp. KNU-44 TaxID=3450744 RepID=UPI003F41DC7F
MPTTYPFEAPLFVDAVTFTRAPNAQITIYDEADTAGTTPLVLTDPNGLSLANPLTSSPDAFGPNFRAPTPRVKWSGGGLTGFLSSPTAVLDEAKAAKAAAETAQASAADAASMAAAAASAQLESAVSSAAASSASATSARAAALAAQAAAEAAAQAAAGATGGAAVREDPAHPGFYFVATGGQLTADPNNPGFFTVTGA